MQDSEQVLMGNHVAADVAGKGSIEINFTSGQKLTLLNVYHVPDMKKNLMSATLLSKKGFKIVIESDHVIVSKNGIFVGKGYNCNGMCKLSIDKINYVSAYIVESDSCLWHARLGHLNCSSLNYMSKNGYISYITQHIKCEICIQAKMTKKPFRKVERSTELLDLIHSDLCELNGELTR